MLAEHHALGLRILGGDLLQGEAELEARTQPRRPDNVVAVHFFGDLFGILGRTNGDGSIWVRVIHVFAGHERVQRRVDGGRARVEVKGTVWIHPHHFVLGRRLRAALFLVRVDGLQRDQFLLIQRGKILLLRCTQIAAGSLNPEYFDLFTRERIGLHNFAGGVAAAGIGNALVATELVGTIDEPIGRIQFLDLAILPEVVHVFILLLRHGKKSERQFSGKMAFDSSQ